MKFYFTKLTFCAGIISTLAASAIATPLKRAEVVANPAWVLHLDFDALRPTAVGRYILSEMDKPENKPKLAFVQAMFSVDLRTQLHGATLYGTSASPFDGVLIVYADFDPDRLATLAQAAKDYQSTEHGRNTIHSWLDDKKKSKDGGPQRIYAAIQGNRVIFGKRENTVAQALDVIAGSQANLAAEQIFPGIGVKGNGHVVEAAAQKMKLPESDPNATILKLSQSIELALGESDQKVNGALTLVADSDEVAGHVLSIVQGLLALAKLQTDKPDSVALANAITITQDGSRVIGKLVLPANNVVQLMKADVARKAEKAKAKENE